MLKTYIIPILLIIFIIVFALALLGERVFSHKVLYSISVGVLLVMLIIVGA